MVVSAYLLPAEVRRCRGLAETARRENYQGPLKVGVSLLECRMVANN